MRYLGLDLGKKRIGVAISDENGIIAGAAGVIQVVSRDQAIGEVVKYLEREQPGQIVIGLPLQLNGQEGIEAGRAREFAEQLGKRTALPIDFMDERLTSVQAERMMQAAGMKRDKRRANIDSQAAAIILQTYMDAKRNRQRFEEEQQQSKG